MKAIYKDRKLKGNSLLEWVDNYVLVDIETTGLSPKENDIIEIGAIFGVSYKNAHRGLTDVEITFDVYNRLREYAIKERNLVIL